MEASGPGVKPVENETRSEAHRSSKAGKTISYYLHVLQQPSRARACGSGAKSSADRRPVDPPPIIELKIFEKNGDEPERDITFAINANYFLFATLEQARNIAHGRNMADNQGQLTVLTGTPVSGMVLLDRPNPAGYFIFPDLSVRHEGKFRLSFSLYEEMKNPMDDDGDITRSPGSAHVTHRLEVRSSPFTVYSAKKFPGLTESTSLSRMVAEQGCRVRIRRDVRMRRRDKPGKEWENYEDETAEVRSRMSATPEVTGYQTLPPPAYMDPVSRPRSSSNTSHHSVAPSLSIPRRPSIQDMGYQQAGYGTAPQTPQSAYPQTSPYGPSPTHYGSASFMQQQQPMQPPPPQYPQHSYQPPQQMSQAGPSTYYPYGAFAPPTHSQVAPGAQSYDQQERQHRQTSEHSQILNDHRRSSEIGYGPPPPRPAQVPEFAFPSNMMGQSGYQSQSQSSYPSHHTQQSSYGSSDIYSNRAGPPEPVQPPTRPTYSTPPFPSRPFTNNSLAPIRAPPPLNNSHNVIHAKHLEPSSPASSIPPSSYYNNAVQTPNESHKRGFGQVFNDHHTQQPLRHGQRPSTGGHYDHPATYYGGADVEGDSHDTEQLKMTYKRSDGKKVERVMPTYQTFQ